MDKEKVKKELSRKFQPQWSFKTYASAKKELDFQRRMNPDTYKWLMKKDIMVGKAIIPTKEVVKKRIIAKKSSVHPSSPEYDLVFWS